MPRGIKVTVEGPQGSGKTRLMGLFAIVCSQHGLSTVSRDEGRHEEFDDMGFDVVMIEKKSAIGRKTVDKIDVLDHGFVRLVDSMGNDLSVVRAARVSYDADWRAGENEGSDQRLLNYLWKNAHTSPFEAVSLTFEVKAPIFVFRQWHRHRTWSYNELSARYRALPEEFYLPNPALIGEQSASNKQMRVIGDADSDFVERQHEVELVEKHCKDSFALYRDLLTLGWPRELARSVLPVNTYSHMFATVNLLNLFRFLTLRDDDHAQYEIRVYAEAMRDLARSVAPICVAAWEKARA